MFPINPLSGALAQSAQIQIQQAADKTKQAQQSRQRARNVAARQEDIDETEHPVENAEELAAIHDDGPQSRQKQKQNQRKHEEEEEEDDTPSGLDLTA